MPTPTVKPRRRHARPMVAFEVDRELHAMLLQEKALTSWKSLSAILRERLWSAYREHPLPKVSR